MIFLLQESTFGLEKIGGFPEEMTTFVPVQYWTVSWSPPLFTFEQEIDFGEHVNRVGRKELRRRFWRELRNQKYPVPPKAAARWWHKPVVFGVLLPSLIYALWTEPAKVGLSFLSILTAVIPVGIMAGLMYYGSAALVLFRYHRWLLRCENQYLLKCRFAERGKDRADPELQVVTCPHCRGKLRLPLLRATLKVTCPHCRVTFFQPPLNG